MANDMIREEARWSCWRESDLQDIHSVCGSLSSPLRASPPRVCATPRIGACQTVARVVELMQQHRFRRHDCRFLPPVRCRMKGRCCDVVEAFRRKQATSVQDRNEKFGHGFHNGMCQKEDNNRTSRLLVLSLLYGAAGGGRALPLSGARACYTNRDFRGRFGRARKLSTQKENAEKMTTQATS